MSNDIETVEPDDKAIQQDSDLTHNAIRVNSHNFLERKAKAQAEFYIKYPNNLDKLLALKASVSGKHAIDPLKAQAWVAAQFNQQRKEAAQDLLDHTKYITFDQVWLTVGDLIKAIYGDLTGQTPVLYVGETEDSTYMMAVIAVFHIRNLGYEDPEITYDYDVRDLEGTKPLIIVNDIIYQTEYLHVQDVYLAGIVASSRTYELHKAGILWDHRVYVANIIPAFKDVIGRQRFLRLSYYWKPFTYSYDDDNDDMDISVYFDHMLSSDNLFRCLSSTLGFNKTLFHGPVLSSNLGYDANMLDAMRCMCPNLVDTQIPNLDINSTEEDFKLREAAIDVVYTEIEGYKAMLDQIIADDQCKPGVGIDFIPFIPNNSQSITILSQNNMISMLIYLSS